MHEKSKNQPEKPILMTVLIILLITFLALVIPSIIFMLTGLISLERWASALGMIVIACTLAIILMTFLSVINMLRRPRKNNEKPKAKYL